MNLLKKQQPVNPPVCRSLLQIEHNRLNPVKAVALDPGGPGSVGGGRDVE